VPVLEGYGMTETATVATSSTPEEHKFGTVGRPLPGVEVKIADDGEILIKGANIFRGYYKNDDASFGAVDEAGCTRATSARSTRTASSRSPAARRTSSSRRAARTSRRPTRERPQAVALDLAGGDARRPRPVPGDPHDAGRGGDRAVGPGAGLPTDVASLAQEPKVTSSSRPSSTSANANYAQVEQVKKFAILDHDFSQETGELTPSLKVKRNVVNEKYAGLLDGLYTP
jgi:long-chain acyl-CoA synthetase